MEYDHQDLRVQLRIIFIAAEIDFGSVCNWVKRWVKWANKGALRYYTSEQILSCVSERQQFNHLRTNTNFKMNLFNVLLTICFPILYQAISFWSQ